MIHELDKIRFKQFADKHFKAPNEQPEPVYGITESELNFIHRWSIPINLSVKESTPRQEMMQRIRSRGIINKMDEPCDTCTYNDVCDQSASESCKRNTIEQIRAEEREKVLDDIAQYCQKHTHHCLRMPLAVVTKEPLLEFMESLRGEVQKK